MAPFLAILFLSFAFRLPILVNASGTNSDAAVVGLQAMHLLRGEYSPFLWGSGYQTSVDSAVAAVFFLVMGPSPLALTLSSLLGHVILTCLVLVTLRRSFAPWTAAVLVLPLVFTPEALHTYILYPPRQASLTLAFAGWVLLNRAGAARGCESARRARFLFAGGTVSSFAVYADPYALLFLPSALVLGTLALAGEVKAPLRRFPAWGLGALAAGLLVGSVPYLRLRCHPQATLGQTSLTWSVLDHNARLLWEDCGPSLLSTRPLAVLDPSSPPSRLLALAGSAIRPFQLLGALLLVAGILSGAVLVGVSRIPAEVRRLGAAGALILPVTVGGFLVSPMVMDHFSSRYLASIVLAAPFALAPAAYLLRLPRLVPTVAPYLVAAAASGWLAFLPFGVRREPLLESDGRLGAALRERGVRFAVADYWAAYRLTFLFGEDPIVVPTNEGEDRYPPYRRRMEDVPILAYVYDGLRSRESPEAMPTWWRTRGWVETGERLRLGSYEVVLLRR
jgi:hypothetical protein